MIRIVHLLPGRLRLRLDALKGRPELAARLREHLAGIAGIQNLEINPRTGSVLLLYRTHSLRSADFLDALSHALGKLFPARIAPGHLHLTLNRLKGNPRLARRIQEEMSAVPGIEHIEIDSRTGDCLLLYDSRVVTSPAFIDDLCGPLESLLPRINVRKLLARAGLA